MGYLKIHCDNCMGSWEVYGSQIDSGSARRCPHCFEEIDRQTWERQIKPAFAALDDANRELIMDHTGYGQSLFRVDYISNGYRKRGNNSDE